MTNKFGKGILARAVTRREFVKKGSLLALSASSFPAVLAACSTGGSGGSKAAPKTLKILQWSHFVPDYDKWFDQWAHAWGEKHGLTVTVDHVTYSDIPTRTAAEVNAKAGHDLILWNSSAAQHERSTVDMGDVVTQVEAKYGRQYAFARLTSFNPHTSRHFGFAYSFAPYAGRYLRSKFTLAGMPDGPTTWDEMLTATSQIKAKTKGAIRAGIGLAPEPDSNMAARALIWAFGGAEQDAESNVTINSDAVAQAVDYMARLFKQAENTEVFGWSSAADNNGMLGGSLSFILSSIAGYRTAQDTRPEVAKDMFFAKPLTGPNASLKALAAPHMIQTYIVPAFSKNQDKAKEFLVDLADHSIDIAYQSKLHELPVNPGAQAQNQLLTPGGWLDSDPFKSDPSDKVRLLRDSTAWTVNIGYPGPASAAAGEVFDKSILPSMMAAVARGQKKPKEAIADAERQMKAIYATWRNKGLIGGSR